MKSYSTLQELPEEVQDKLSQHNLLLLGRVGSYAYGTDTEDSDVDLMGVFIPSKDDILGLGYKTVQDSYDYKFPDHDIEIVLYDIRKFTNLVLKGNPNVTPLLFLTRENSYLTQTDQAFHFVDILQLSCMSKKMYAPLVGYATSQLSRIEGKNTGKLGDKRKALVEKYGYDTKFAHHAIRLLLVARTLFRHGLYPVHMKVNKKLLLDIRNGKYTHNQYMELWRRHLEYAQKAFEEMQDNLLPEYPNTERAESLVTNFLLTEVLDEDPIY